MHFNAIEGIVENGRIRLREDVALPENAKVYVIVADERDTAAPRLRSPRLADCRQSGDFRKQVVELPHDAKL